MYTAWASVVVRSVGVGNAKALYSGTSDNCTDSHAFFVLMLKKKKCFVGEPQNS